MVQSQTEDLTQPVIEVQGRFVEQGDERVYDRVDPVQIDPRERPDVFHILRGFEKDPGEELVDQDAA